MVDERDTCNLNLELLLNYYLIEWFLFPLVVTVFNLQIVLVGCTTVSPLDIEIFKS